MQGEELMQFQVLWVDCWVGMEGSVIDTNGR